MARKKKYDEAEVLEKALTLFWTNGYENTSTRMLEKEMGINQFSIYSSFGNKEGVLIESLKLYQQKIKVITSKLQASKIPVAGIKQYFYDFLEFSKGNNCIAKGCLITNTMNEFGVNNESAINSFTIDFIEEIKRLFYNNLKLDTTKDKETLKKQTNYLFVSIASLATSSKIFDKDMLTIYIEHTFNNI